MKPERYHQVSAAFDKIVRCGPDRREALLAEVCMGDPELRAEVERMLAADAEARRESFLDVPTDPVRSVARPNTEGPGDRVGPYKLLQRSARGAWATVLPRRARRAGPPPRRLKIIKPGMDTAQVIARFAAERQALAIDGSSRTSPRSSTPAPPTAAAPSS